MVKYEGHHEIEGHFVCFNGQNGYKEGIWKEVRTLPWSYDLDLRNLVDPPVSKVLMSMWLVCGYGLPKRDTCASTHNYYPVTLDLIAR